MPSNHLILYHALILLPSIISSIRVFSNKSQLFASGGQSTRASASASVLPMNIQDWFALGLTGLISLQSKSLPQHHSSKASILWCSVFFMMQLSHPCMTTGKTIALTIGTFIGKGRLVMMYWMPWSQCFECWVLSRLFHCPLSPSSRGSLVHLHFLLLEWYHLHIWGCWYFSQESWFQLAIKLGGRRGNGVEWETAPAFKEHKTIEANAVCHRIKPPSPVS